jgi:hypothetical protein
MAKTLLDALDHYCFHSPRLNIHKHPNLHHCTEKECPGAISAELAAKAGLQDEDGTVKCPLCNCDTYPKGEWTEIEVHAHLCTDPTIHYPKMYKAGKLSKDAYDAWKATLTREEQLGYYKRVPHHPIVAKINRDEAALMKTDLASFTKLVNERVKDSAERCLLFQSLFRHETTQISSQLLGDVGIYGSAKD